MFKYEIDLTWQEDRTGNVSSPALPLTIEVATPPEFPKGIPGIWSPEHFFVAAINSCLMTTFLAVAENSKLEFLKFDCKAIGTVDKVEGKYMVTEVILRPVLVIQNPEHHDKAKRILEMSEKACMISNSVTSKIILEPTVLVA